MGLFIRKSIEALQAEAKETGSGTLKRVLGIFHIGNSHFPI